jgi:hypothetical protein
MADMDVSGLSVIWPVSRKIWLTTVFGPFPV